MPIEKLIVVAGSYLVSAEIVSAIQPTLCCGQKRKIHWSCPKCKRVNDHTMLYCGGCGINGYILFIYLFFVPTPARFFCFALGGEETQPGKTSL